MTILSIVATDTDQAPDGRRIIVKDAGLSRAAILRMIGRASPPEPEPEAQPQSVGAAATHARRNGYQPDEPPRQRGDPGPGGEPVEKPKPNFRTLLKFCSEFRPISYAVAGLMREGSLYTLTGRTGEGKTTFLVKLALAVATGQGERMIGRKVKKGRVAFATAENPDDLRMRFMVACFVFGIDLEVIDDDILISDNRVAPEDIVDWIKKTGEAFTLILIDTWQAFFDGKEPNNNAEAVGFTRRFRPLAKVNGEPVVIIAAHPPKQAGDDSLLPYGGGGTLNEIDGNFTLMFDNGLYRFHWQGKIRGLPFDPLHYRIDKLDSPDVITVEGARVQMPVMFPVDEEAAEARETQTATEDAKLLKAIYDSPEGSTQNWADAAGIKKRRVQAKLNKLAKQRLGLRWVANRLGKWRLTDAGARAVEEHFALPPRARKRASKGGTKKTPTARRTAKRTAGAKTVREAEKLQ
jgi:hypothetical protein